MDTYAYRVEKRRAVALTDVSAGERERYYALHSAKRAAYLSARQAIKILLAERYGGEPTSYVVLSRDDGSPYVVNRPDIRCSISHSREHVAVMVGAGAACGIDVEEKRATVPALFHYIASETEIARVSAVFPAQWAPLVAWCTKEAAFKCQGGSLHLNEYRIVAVSRDTCMAVVKRGNSRFHIFIEMADNYLYAYGHQQ